MKDILFFFKKLSKQQKPSYFWIGCSDSRVSENDILGLAPGDVFVHRNIANIVVNSDLNFLSVLQYAVEVLNIREIIVCGHYGCGGVESIILNKSYGLIDNWLGHIYDVCFKHNDILKLFDSYKEIFKNILYELNDIILNSNLSKKKNLNSVINTIHKMYNKKIKNN